MANTTSTRVCAPWPDCTSTTMLTYADPLPLSPPRRPLDRVHAGPVLKAQDLKDPLDASIEYTCCHYAKKDGTLDTHDCDRHHIWHVRRTVAKRYLEYVRSGSKAWDPTLDLTHLPTWLTEAAKVGGFENEGRSLGLCGVSLGLNDSGPEGEREYDEEAPNEALMLREFKIGRKVKPTPMPCVIISDPGEDLDDELAMIMLRYLVSQDHLICKAIVANLKPSDLRARLTRGTLDELGMSDVRVGQGTDGGSKNHEATFMETAKSYMPGKHDERTKVR